MANTSEIKNGLCIEHSNDIYSVVEFLHVKPGKGPAFVRTKLKSMSNGKVVTHTFPSSHKISIVRVERRKYQYLYNDGEIYHFMNNETFEQIAADEKAVGENVKWLVENDTCTITLWNGAPIVVQPANFVELEITETDPGLKGDTAGTGGKPATLSSGAVIRVPLFVQTGEVVKVDTRSGEYVSRAQK